MAATRPEGRAGRGRGGEAFRLGAERGWPATPAQPIRALDRDAVILTWGQRSRKKGLKEAGIKIDRRNINNLRYADNTTLLAENAEELKSFLMEVKEESEKAGLKLSIQKTKIIAFRSHHFMAKRWGNNGNSHRLYFLGLQKLLQMVTAAMKLKDASSLEEKP